MTVVRHQARTKARVIELYESGWRPTEIERVLVGEGIQPPSRNTMWVWTHPEKAARQSARDCASTRRWRLERASFAWPGIRGPEWRLQRMRVLKANRLSSAAIASVMSIDFPEEPISRHQVERALAEGRPPRPYRELVSAA